MVRAGRREWRRDAAKKRDEVAARLDQKTLAAAKLAAQSFAPEREPDEAVNLKAPAGGWDTLRLRRPSRGALGQCRRPNSRRSHVAAAMNNSRGELLCVDRIRAITYTERVRVAAVGVT